MSGGKTLKVEPPGPVCGRPGQRRPSFPAFLSSLAAWVGVAWLGVVLVLSSGRQALAGTETLAWIPVIASDLAGYKIFYGTFSGTYTYVVDVGNVTTYTFTNLPDCTTYYFAVKAYDTSGNLSTAYTNEVSGTARPTVTAVNPTSARQNTSNLNLTLTGTNFHPGATVLFSGTGFTLNSVTVASCTSLTANVSIALTAPAGVQSLTVRNTDQSSGTGSNLFTVTLADTRPPEVRALQVSDAGGGNDRLSWEGVDPAAWPGAVYDIVVGYVSQLRADRGYFRDYCLVADLGNTAYTHVWTGPPLGEAVYYLVRGHTAAGFGTYGDSGLLPDPRDRLDASTSPCP